MRHKAARIGSKHVCVVTVTDPDTHLPVEVEIRKMETGPMVGFDGSFLEQLDEDEHPRSPYDEDAWVIVPDDDTDDGASHPDAWSRDEVQFPRLIAELDMAGALAEPVVAQLCESMDLEQDEVWALVSRAQHAWDRIKNDLT